MLNADIQVNPALQFPRKDPVNPCKNLQCRLLANTYLTQQVVFPRVARDGLFITRCQGQKSRRLISGRASRWRQAAHSPEKQTGWLREFFLVWRNFRLQNMSLWLPYFRKQFQQTQNSPFISHFGTCSVNYMHLCLWKTLTQDCTHGEIRHCLPSQLLPYQKKSLLDSKPRRNQSPGSLLLRGWSPRLRTVHSLFKPPPSLQ